MRLIPFLLACIFIAPSQAISSVALAGYIKEAKDLKAPLTAIALSRLNDPDFGSSRKARSTDVIVFNTTPLKFTLEESDCEEGSFTEDFRPDSSLEPSTSIIYGSDGDSGVDCKVKYVTEEGSYFQVGLSNPLSGKKEFVMELTPDLVVSVDMGTGANNIVKVIVKENPDYVPEEYEEEEVA